MAQIYLTNHAEDMEPVNEVYMKAFEGCSPMPARICIGGASPRSLSRSSPPRKLIFLSWTTVAALPMGTDVEIACVRPCLPLSRFETARADLAQLADRRQEVLLVAATLYLDALTFTDCPSEREKALPCTVRRVVLNAGSSSSSSLAPALTARSACS